MSNVAPSWMAAVIWAAPKCLPSIGREVQWVSVTAPTLRRALNSRPRDGGRDAKSMSSRPPDRPLSHSMASLLARRPRPHRSPHVPLDPHVEMRREAGGSHIGHD